MANHLEHKAESAEVLIVVVTDVERDAVLEAATAETSRKFVPYHGRIRTYYLLGNIGGAGVALVQSGMGSVTPGGSISTVMTAIEELSPTSVIMAGIAFGVDPKKQKIGQILVSTQIQQYEVRRIGTNDDRSENIVPRGSKVPASTRLVGRFQAATVDHKDPPVIFGLVLSGEKLVDNRDYRDSLLHLEPESIGGDMEAAGLFSAVHDHPGVEWIVVKAICDWADGNKRKNKKQRQGIAANNAARLVIETLCKGGFVQSRERRSSPLEEDKPIFEGPLEEPADRVPHFRGRDKDLAKLRQALDRRESAVCVVAFGLGGIGKTALVRQFVATEAEALFPGGSAWLDGMSLLLELGRVAKRFGYPEGQPSAEVARRWLVEQLRERRVLLVVDNVDLNHVDEKYIPLPGGRCKTILTSRLTTLHKKFEKEAIPLELNRWDVPTCREYFREVARKLVGVPDKELNDLAEYVGRLPLAIRLLSQLLMQHGTTPASVLESLKKAPIETLDKEAADDKGVAAAFVVSFNKQSAPHQSVLVALAACAQGTTAERVAEVADVTEEEATDALGKLATQSLVEFTDGATRPWGLHDVVRLFVRYYQKKEFQEACSRLVAWATKYAVKYTIDVWIRDYRDRFEELRSCEADLMLAWHWANETRSLPEAITLWQNLWVYREMAYQWEDAIKESCKTRELLSADANKYRLIERWIEVNSLGYCQLKLGRLEEAERTLTDALKVIAKDPPPGDDWGTSPLAAGMPHVLKSVAHRHLAAVYQAMMQERKDDSPKDFAIMREKAQAEAENALSCAKEIKAHECSKESAVNVAVSQVTLAGSLQPTKGQKGNVKDLERALGLLDSALKELDCIHDYWRLAAAYFVKGLTLKNLERYDEAEDNLVLARARSERIKRLDTYRSATIQLLEIKEELGDTDACDRLRDDLDPPPPWEKTQ